MGIDDTHMKIRGAPVLDEPALSPHQKMIADKLAVSELMSMAVVALPPIVQGMSPCLESLLLGGMCCCFCLRVHRIPCACCTHVFLSCLYNTILSSSFTSNPVCIHLLLRRPEHCSPGNQVI